MSRQGLFQGHTLANQTCDVCVTLSLTLNECLHASRHEVSDLGDLGLQDFPLTLLQTTFLYHYLHKLLNMVTKVLGTLGAGISGHNPI